jgi:hypothetical protein
MATRSWRRFEQATNTAKGQDKPTADEKVCPFYAQTIKAAAIKCRYCGSNLSPGQFKR